MLIGILIGIVIWQLIATIILIVTNEDEDKVIAFATGVFMILALGIGQIVSIITPIYNGKKYYLVNFKNITNDCEVFFIKKKHIEQLSFVPNSKGNFIEIRDYSPKRNYIISKRNIVNKNQNIFKDYMKEEE